MMQKLFQNDFIFEKGFLSADVCKKWETTIFENLPTFGTDVEPKYGQMAAFYGMIEAA